MCAQWYLMMGPLIAVVHRQHEFRERRFLDADGDGRGEFGGLLDVLPLLMDGREENGPRYEPDPTRANELNQRTAFVDGVIAQADGSVLIYESHFMRPGYRARAYLPEETDGREAHFAVLMWPLQHRGYTNWTFLASEQGLFKTDERFARQPTLADAYDGKPFVSRPRWQRLTRWLGTKLGPDEQ